MSLKRSIKHLISKIPIPLKNYILLESRPDLSDNTKAVFDELIRRKVNEKIKLIWIVRDTRKTYDKCKNVRYISTNLLILYYRVFSKVLICSNGFLISLSKNQKSIYLTHGIPIKNVRNYYTMPEEINYLLSPSVDVCDLMAYQFKVPSNKVLCLGYPRNDVFFQNPKSVVGLFGNNSFRKVIVWYPTFRQQKNGVKHGKDSLPLIHSEENAERINKLAKSLNVLIVIKPHFAQDLDYIKKIDLSNIMFINDDFFDRNNLSSYELLNACDALITDYSSVYYDFTLCDKPIAVIWEDIDEYRKEPGFAVDLDFYLKGAEKIFDIDELCTFINNVAHGVDRFKKERNEIKELVSITDGNSSKRVVDFIIDWIKIEH